jgi:hypothetical protein
MARRSGWRSALGRWEEAETGDSAIAGADEDLVARPVDGGPTGSCAGEVATGAASVEGVEDLDVDAVEHLHTAAARPSKAISGSSDSADAGVPVLERHGVGFVTSEGSLALAFADQTAGLRWISGEE